MLTFTCCICHKEYQGYGNNPDPIIRNSSVKCCDQCNSLYVIPFRYMQFGLSSQTFEKLRSEFLKAYSIESEIGVE